VTNSASRYPDLLNYRDGIYHHVASGDGVSSNPWEETNHAVVVVGWGVDDATQENYWIVKNSWGRHFGLTGYFYVRRSTDEIAIESMALSAGVPHCLRHDAAAQLTWNSQSFSEPVIQHMVDAGPDPSQA
jgi:C1A family cysteine protease